MPSGDGMVHLFDVGRGRPIVLWLGMPQAPAAMEVFASRIDGVRAWVVHSPGYGRSPAPTLPIDLGTTRTRVAEALALAGVTRAVHVGLSGGTYQAMGFAATWPQQVDGLFLMAPLAGMPPEMKSRYVDLAAAIRAGALTPEVAVAFAVSGAHAERVGRDAALAYCRDALGAVTRDVLAAELDAVREGPDWSDAMRRLALPAVLRVGALDPTTTPSMARALAAGWPGAEVQVVPGVGHDLVLEDPDSSAAALSAFVNALP